MLSAATAVDWAELPICTSDPDGEPFESSSWEYAPELSAAQVTMAPDPDDAMSGKVWSPVPVSALSLATGVPSAWKRRSATPMPPASKPKLSHTTWKPVSVAVTLG